MKKVVARRWIKDLTSKRFKQTQLTLREPEGKGFAYCCLGVLSCSIKDRPEVKKTGWRWVEGAWRNKGMRCEESDSLPSVVAHTIGLENQSVFITMNDKMGYTFEEIAAEVEEQFLAPARKKAA